MFEITLGNWVPICRHLMDNVTERYAILIMIYRLFVCEGILKVISAIFLQQTMQCANNDDQLMVQNRVRQRARFSEKMHRLLTETDKDGDGHMSRAEFSQIIANPRIKLWLQAMELNIRDPDKFFTLLDKQGDGELDVDELISGMSVLKGPATQLHIESTETVILQHLRTIENTILWLQNEVEASNAKVASRVTTMELNMGMHDADKDCERATDMDMGIDRQESRPTKLLQGLKEGTVVQHCI